MVVGVHWVAALLLLVTPGSWFAFQRASVAFSLSARFALAVVLSPIVVAAEFYLLRLAGVRFEVTAIAIAVINLPALFLIARRLRDGRGFALKPALLSLPYLLLPAAYLMVFAGNPQFRANHGHSWTQASIAYTIANGELRPEEAHLAGVRLVYPWLGSVYQGVVSFIADSAPASSFVATNVIWLLAVIALVVHMVGRLGGSPLARASTAAWLCFSVNIMGWLSRHVLPASVIKRYAVWGDPRYTPWVRKFGVYEQTIFGIGIFAAVVVVLAEFKDSEPSDYSLLLLGPLLLSAALIYPVLYPATMALVAGHFTLLIVSRRREPKSLLTTGNVALAGLAVASALAGVGYLAVVAADHAGAAAMGLTDAYHMRIKAATSIVVLLPLLAGFAFVARGAWRSYPRDVSLLTFGALACVVLHAVLSIPYNDNEYKFIFVAGVSLTPFVVLATMRPLGYLRRGALPAALMGAVILAMPFFSRVQKEVRQASDLPALELGSFSFSLKLTDPLSRVLTSIRTTTPRNAVLVAGPTTLDLAALTRRSTYVLMDTASLIRGIGLRSNYLLKLSRGYSADLVEARRKAVRALFEGADTLRRTGGLDQILHDVRRPVVVLVRRPEDAQLDDWLRTQRDAHSIFADARFGAWMVMPSDARMTLRDTP